MRRSEAFLKFKVQRDEVFNFAVLVTSSVPSLKRNISLFEKGKISRLPDTDYFQPSVTFELTPSVLKTLEKAGVSAPILEQLEQLMQRGALGKADFVRELKIILGEKDYKEYRNYVMVQSKDYVDNLKDCAVGYKEKLATYLYFSIFSYFEVFITDLAIEVFQHIHPMNRDAYLRDIKAKSNSLAVEHRHLDGRTDPRKKDRYKKYSRKMREEGYKEPEEVLFPSLLTNYKKKVEDLKAKDIPQFLEDTFSYVFTSEEKNYFDNMRDNRNKIAHNLGGFSPTMRNVIELHSFFKTLSAQIDEHVMLYFIKPKNYTS